MKIRMRGARLFLGALLLFSAYSTVLGGVKDKRVEGIFVPAGDVLECVPELIAQLEVPAVLDLGFIADAPERVFDATGVCPFEPVRFRERYVRRFEFGAGTVREALEAFCRQNIAFEWDADDREVYLTRQIAPRHAIDVFLRHRIGHHTFDPMRDSPWSKLEEILNPIAKKVFEGRDAPTFGEQYAVFSMWDVVNGDRWVFEGRMPIGSHVYQMPANPESVTDLLAKFDGDARNYFWFIYLEPITKGTHGNRYSPEVSLNHTSWSPQRRGMSIPELVRCLDPRESDLHGYRNVEVRMEDAMYELRRRNHYHPDAVRSALLAEGALDAILTIGQDNPPSKDVAEIYAKVDAQVRPIKGLLRGVLALDDDALIEYALKVIVNRKDLNPKEGPLGYDGRQALIESLPQPWEDRFVAVCVPLFQRLADHDPDPAIRQFAKKMMAWHERRMELLDLAP